MSLRARLVHGALWSTLENVVNQALNFLIFLVLVRLLTPADYGLVGMAMVAVTFTNVLMGEELADGLIQIETIEQRHLDTMFNAALLGGLVLAGLLLLLAAPIANLYQQPSVGAIVMVLAIVPLLNSVSVVPKALVRRDMQFRVFALRGLMATGGSGIVGISAAVGGLGVWSLVAAQLTRSLIEALVLWTASAYRPKAAMDRRAFVELAPFTMRMAGVRMCQFAETKLPRAVIGVFLGPAPLGLFIFASNLVLMISNFLILPFLRVITPAVARMQSDENRTQQLLNSSFQLINAALLPLLLGLAVVSPFLMGTVVGNQWAGSTQLIQIFAISSVLASEAIFSAFLRGRGETSALLKARMLGVLLTVVALFTVVSGDLVVLTLALCLRTMISYQLPAIVLFRKRALSFGRLIVQSVRSLAAAGLMAGCVWMLVHAIPPGSSNWFLLLSAIGAGALTYPLFLLILNRSVFRDVFDLARQLK